MLWIEALTTTRSCRWYDEHNKGFGRMQWMMGAGVVILATMMSLYQFLS